MLLMIAAFLGIVLLYATFAVFGVRTLFFDDRLDEDSAMAEQPAAREQTTGGEQSSGLPVQVSSGQFHAVEHEDANDVDTVLDSGFLDLRRLKGNQGDQSYDLPAGFDPKVYQAISVWCKRFTANFAAAPLR